MFKITKKISRTEITLEVKKLGEDYLLTLPAEKSMWVQLQWECLMKRAVEPVLPYLHCQDIGRTACS